jgi:hypothetical protein
VGGAPPRLHCPLLLLLLMRRRLLRLPLILLPRNLLLHRIGLLLRRIVLRVLVLVRVRVRHALSLAQHKKHVRGRLWTTTRLSSSMV